MPKPLERSREIVRLFFLMIASRALQPIGLSIMLIAEHEERVVGGWLEVRRTGKTYLGVCRLHRLRGEEPLVKVRWFNVPTVGWPSCLNH